MKLGTPGAGDCTGPGWRCGDEDGPEDVEEGDSVSNFWIDWGQSQWDVLKDWR